MYDAQDLRSSRMGPRFLPAPISADAAESRDVHPVVTGRSLEGCASPARHRVAARLPPTSSASRSAGVNLSRLFVEMDAAFRWVAAHLGLDQGQGRKRADGCCEQYESSMSDSETPNERNGTERDFAAVPPAPGAGEQVPQPAGPHAPVERPAVQIAKAQRANARARTVTTRQTRHARARRAERGTDRGPRLGQAARTRRAAWAALALLCVVAGTVASIFGAHALARHDANKQSAAFGQNATSVAAATKLALQRGRIRRSAGTSSRQRQGHTGCVRALGQVGEDAASLPGARQPRADRDRPQIPARDVRGPRHRPRAEAGHPGGRTGDAEAFPVIPASDHHYYCLATAELVRSASLARPVGQDYCALSPGLLSDRDKGLSRYTVISSGGQPALAIVTPVYRGNATPHTAFGRAAASVGWLREVLVPTCSWRPCWKATPESRLVSVIERREQPHLRHGTPPAGARNATTNLQNGWTVTASPCRLPRAVFSNGETTALLVGGIVWSLLIGLLVFVLGGGRARGSRSPGQRSRAPARRSARRPHRAAQPGADARPRRAHARPRRTPVRAARRRAVHRHRLVQGRQREARRGRRRPAPEDRRRTARGRRARRRHRRPSRRRRVRDAGRIGGPRRAPGHPRAACGRVSAQAVRARRLRPAASP